MPRPKLKKGEKGNNGRAGYRMCMNCRRQYPAEQHYVIRLISERKGGYIINVCEKCKKENKVQIVMNKGIDKKNLLKETI